MIIVAGHLRVHPADRDRFLALSHSPIAAARVMSGCHDFVVAADPLEEDRVNVYERWEDYDTLHKFRGHGPNAGLTALIVTANVEEFEVTLRLSGMP